MARSNSSEPTWQSILDALTAKARKEGLVRAVKSARTYEDKVSKVMDSIAIRGKLSTWISQCAESQYSKSGGTATKLRDEGNAKFRCHDNEGSLRLFTESVICSPEYGPELSLAYGNRSATLYHAGLYEDCMQDISLALHHRYPRNLEYKLYQRRGQCATKLGRTDEAQKAFGAALNALQYVPKLTSEKRESLSRDIHALMAEADHVVVQPDVELVLPPAELSNGSVELPGASSCLQVKESKDLGRHVVASKEVKIGDVLFNELPYSCVLLPEHYSSHCHHCVKPLTAPVSCLKCTQPRYCSDECRSASWNQYHRHECTGLDLLHSVGVAHLALRTVLVCGLPTLLKCKGDMRRNKSKLSSGYGRVYNLVSHVDRLDPDDLFQYTVTAALLLSYLERRTKFFDTTTKSNEEMTHGMDNLSINNEVDEDDLLLVGGALLKHITQLLCNASAIYEVGSSCNSDLDDEGGPVVNNSQYRIATALYPSASMMNHSCDPSVINSFHNKRLIVRAIKNVEAGAQVFNCYGPHFRRHSLLERQEVLRDQYHFVCECTSCRRKELVEFQERFSALRCHFCGGPIQNPQTEASLAHSMPCWDCGREQEYSDRIEQVFVAYDLFKKGMEALQYGNMADALSALQSCYQIRVKAMYAHHREVTEVADQLARCYAMMGSFSESAQYLKVCLPAIQERFGPHSIEVGHELVKYTDVLLGDLQDSTKRISLFEEKILESRACLERAAQIFDLHYGPWHKTHQEIKQKLDKTQFLVQKA